MFWKVFRALVLVYCVGYSSQFFAQTIDGPTEVCVGQTTMFQLVNGPSAGVDWQLISPPLPGRVIGITPQAITIVWEDNGNYVLTGILPDGTNVTTELTITEAPEIIITADAGVACGRGEGKVCIAHCLDAPPVTFSVAPYAATDNIIWTSTGPVTFSNANAADVLVSFSGTGSFEITAVLTTDAGCEDEFVYCGFVEDIPDTEIEEITFGTTDPIQICRNQDLSFGFNLPPNAARVEWRLTDGITTTVETSLEFDHVFDVAGLFQLELWLFTECGCAELADVVSIEVDPGEQFEVLCPEVVCSGDLTTYTIDVTQGQGLNCNDVIWDAGPNGTVIGSGTVVQVQWNTVVNSTVAQLTITPVNCPGCPLPTVIDVPIIGTSITPVLESTNCFSFQQTVGVPNLPGVTYVWSIDDDPRSIATLTNTGASSQTITFSEAGGVTVAVEVIYNQDCIANGTIDVVRLPLLNGGSRTVCLGDDIILNLFSPFGGTGSASFEFGAMNGNVDLTAVPVLTLTADVLEPIDLVLSNFVLDGKTSTACEWRATYNVIQAQPIDQIIGADMICAGGTYQYGADPSLPGVIEWTVSGGLFGDGGTTTNGQTVNVTWNAAGPYKLTAVRRERGCLSEPIVLEPQVLVDPTTSIAGNAFPCADGDDPEVYTLTCGSQTPCMAGQNYVWTVDPAYGSIVDGQNSANVSIAWHIPSSGSNQTAVQVQFDLCGTTYSANYPVELQFPGDVELSGTPVGCAGSTFSFTATANGNLAVTNALWQITDQAGTVYSILQSGANALTLDWNSGSVVPEVTAGFANVTVTVTYDNCGFTDIGRFNFEILFNPIPEFSRLGEEICDEKGNPRPSEFNFIASTSAGASEVFFLWERVCADGATTLLSGVDQGLLNLLVDPTLECCYRLTTTRTYTRDGQTYSCSRSSGCEFISWECGDGCGGYCPTIDLIDNTAPPGDPSPTCGTVLVRGNSLDCTGGAIDIQGVPLNFGSWTITPTTSSVTVGPISSNNSFIIESFSNGFHPFSTFEDPLVYEIEYAIASNLGTPEEKCGKAERLVEITLVPHLTYRAECNLAEDDEYIFVLRDGTDVIHGGQVASYQWTVSDDSGVIATSTQDNDEISIPAREVSYDVTVCLQPSALQVYVDQGTNYSCEVCETYRVPGRPIAEFTTARDELCAGTAFEFSYVDPMDEGSEFFWDFGDGTLSRQSNPTKVFATPGNYTITLTHINSIGCESTSSIMVTVNPDNLAGDITAALDGPCLTSATLTFVADMNQPGIAPYEYDWSPIPGTVNPLTATESGVYTVEVIDGAGCLYNAAPVGVNLNEAFFEGIETNSPICSGTPLEYFFVGSDDYDYQFSIDGGASWINTQPDGTRFIFGTGNLVGTVSLDIRAVTPGGMDACDTRTTVFTVNPVPDAPVIEGPIIDCSDGFSATYNVQGGDPVTWFAGGLVVGVGNTITVFGNFSGSFISAETIDGGCRSVRSNAIAVPQSPEASILAGCFTCTNVPTMLEDVTGGSYDYWEWQFIPDGSTTPVTCQPMSGSGQVIPWTNFYPDCGDGKYRLFTRIDFDGQICEATTDEVCLTCPTASSCTGPDWVAENTVCLSSPEPGYDLYYINYHAWIADGDVGVTPCVDGITIDGGVFFGDLYLSDEGSAFNLEGQVLVESGVSLNDVCITIPYVDQGVSCSSGNYCDEQVVCLGEEDLELVCELNPCEGEVTLGGVDIDCPGSDGNTAIIPILLQDIVLQVPSACTEDNIVVQIHSETGEISSQVDPGGNRYDLDGVFDAGAGTFTIDEIGLDLLSYSGQRLFCFRFDVKCGSSDVLCSASLCIELPEECVPADAEGETPEVKCEGESEGMKVYSAFIPFKDKSPRSQNGYDVISTSFGAFSKLQFAKASSASVLVFAPKELSGTWILFGDPDLKRDETEMTDVITGKTIRVPVPKEGDVIRYIRFPDCNGLQARSVWSADASTSKPPLSAMLSVAPNPAADRITITVVLPESSSLNWESLRLVGVDGRQYSAASLVQTDDRAELLLVDLPPGWYSVSVITNTGESLHAYFIKQ